MAHDLCYSYPNQKRLIDSLHLHVGAGEVVGVFGPSGCGKSTIGRLVSGYLRPQAGHVEVDGALLPAHGVSPVQYVHQSSIFAVNPRWKIGRILAEAWRPDALTRDQLGVSSAWLDHYPHEISGGELQRIALLRALAPSTRYLVLDEVSAMLDPLTQAAIWRALLERVSRGLGILAISHDSDLLRRVAHRVVQIRVGIRSAG